MRCSSKKARAYPRRTGWPAEPARRIAGADETGEAGFPEVRDHPIWRVVTNHSTGAGAQEFHELVLARMNRGGVNPTATHRYFREIKTRPGPGLT